MIHANELRKTKRLLLALALLVAACASPPHELTAFTVAPVATESSAASESKPPRISGRSDLRELLALALARNPRIHAARERVLAASESGRIDRALPDPKVMLGWYATPVQTRVGPQDFSLGVQQTIPFPSKLRVRSELGNTLARRERVALERVVRDVLVEVVHVAHELVYIDAAIEISGQIAQLLERYTAAAAKAETGSPLPDLFRAETQRAQLDNDRVVLIELRAVEAERLRSLLDLPASVAIHTPRTGPTPRVDARFSDLLAIARAHNQELKEAGLSVQAAALRTSLARKSRLPNFTVGYTHVFTDDLPSSVGNPSGNGDDAQIIHFGITLPLWAGSNRAKIRQARARERLALQTRRDVTLRLRSRVASAWFSVGNAKRLADLYGDVLVPRAETAARTAEDLHSSGKGSLAGTIETVAVLHNFRLAAARARADHGQAVAALESVLGRPLSDGEGRSR